MVVSAATGSQSAAEVTKALNEPTLHAGVYVLIPWVGLKKPLGHSGLESGDLGFHKVQVRLAEQAGCLEDAGVGPGLPKVVGREAEVEMHRPAQRRHGRCWTTGESSTP